MWAPCHTQGILHPHQGLQPYLSGDGTMGLLAILEWSGELCSRGDGFCRLRNANEVVGNKGRIGDRAVGSKIERKDV